MEPWDRADPAGAIAAAAARCSNWNRWGPQDVRGTLNFISSPAPAATAGAARGWPGPGPVVRLRGLAA